MVIAFTIAPVCTGHGVLTNIDRTKVSIGTGYTNRDYFLAFVIFYRHIFFNKKIDIDFLAVVNHIPKILQHLVGILHTRHFKRSIFLFVNTKQYNTTIGISKRRICLPHRVRDASLCLLSLQSITFPV